MTTDDNSMSNAPRESRRHPLLEALLEEKGLEPKGIYGLDDAARILGASRRTIQSWMGDGKLIGRDLPGRGRFLSEDLERFLRGSIKQRKPQGR